MASLHGSNHSVVALLHLVSNFPDRRLLLRHRTVKVALGDRRIKYPAQPGPYSRRQLHPTKTRHIDHGRKYQREAGSGQLAGAGQAKTTKTILRVHVVQGAHRGPSAEISALWRRVAKPWHRPEEPAPISQNRAGAVSACCKQWRDAQQTTRTAGAYQRYVACLITGTPTGGTFPATPVIPQGNRIQKFGDTSSLDGPITGR